MFVKKPRRKRIQKLQIIEKNSHSYGMFERVKKVQIIEKKLLQLLKLKTPYTHLMKF